jgi:hypothetical protein
MDKGEAKIQNCSEEALKLNKTWGSMNAQNKTTMKNKLVAGQVRRNVRGPKDAQACISSKAHGQATVFFKQSCLLGSSVLIFQQRRSDIPHQAKMPPPGLGAAGPAARTTTSASSHGKAASTTPPICGHGTNILQRRCQACMDYCDRVDAKVQAPANPQPFVPSQSYAQPASKAAARPAAPAPSCTPLPKFVSLSSWTPAFLRAAEPATLAPKAKARSVVLHTYSVGLEHLLEGQSTVSFRCLID